MKLFNLIKVAAISAFCLIAIMATSQNATAQTTRGYNQGRSVTRQGDTSNYQWQQHSDNGGREDRGARGNTRDNRDRDDNDQDQDDSHYNRNHVEHRSDYDGGSNYRSSDRDSRRSADSTFNQVRNGRRH